ncbi:FHA domain-containing protein [Frankia sp. Cppng1_Ct_nod]|uniref:FHA domain-containing protein n=1 Tax=Frankia sp. Cppng1_Ct_nod TaxID=2897162 RepID=UPI001A93F555|nr:FHA domain-containing protein [Frankia sp. Cppng1_Ct_nod]
MSYLVVQKSSEPIDTGEAGEHHKIVAGQTLTFGRGAPGIDVDLVLSNPGISRLAGEIAAVSDHWTLTNFSSTRSYVVDNIEGGGEHVRVAPRRLAAPIPFELARIVLPTPTGGCGITVFAPGHAFVASGVGRVSGSNSEPTVDAFSLDESARYFQVLVALCEPRLRDATSAVVPTTTQVVERLGFDRRQPTLTSAGVTYHIDYLARYKLRTRPLEQSGAGRGTAKRDTLVAVALRFGLVGPEHLALLPPRR